MSAFRESAVTRDGSAQLPLPQIDQRQQRPAFGERVVIATPANARPVNTPACAICAQPIAVQWVRETTLSRVLVYPVLVDCAVVDGGHRAHLDCVTFGPRHSAAKSDGVQCARLPEARGKQTGERRQR